MVFFIPGDRLAQSLLKQGAGGESNTSL